MPRDRLDSITHVMQELEVIRAVTKDLPGRYKFDIELGQCDLLTELHRLLYEFEIPGSNRDGGSTTVSNIK